MSKYSLKLLVCILVLIPLNALAHTEEAGTGFLAGLLHPILGTDHLLAMLSVGIVSAQFGGRSVWLVPALFVCFMVTGGLAGAFGFELPYVEVGIALSVIMLGVGISVAHSGRKGRWLIPCAMIFVALFGFLHGHAHGVEMPQSASPVYYSFGFVISTTGIHLMGVLIGFLFTVKERMRKVSPALGFAIAGAGCYILANLQP